MKVEPFASSIILMLCMIPLFQFILLIELEFNNVLDIMQKVDNTYSLFTITANILRYLSSQFRFYESITIYIYTYIIYHAHIVHDTNISIYPINRTGI